MTDPHFVVDVQLYASDNSAFLRDFSESFAKLSELGWYNLAPVTYNPLDATHPVAAPSSNQVQLKAGLEFTWRIEADGYVSATLKINAIVGWMAIGVSKEGRMVHPASSFAVVASREQIRHHILVAQDPTNLTHTAPLHAAQDIHNASFVRADGASTLSFRAELAWFLSYLNVASDTICLIYAHSTLGDSNEAFGYHGTRRGGSCIAGFEQLGQMHSTPSTPPIVAPPVSPPQAPLNSSLVDLLPHPGVRLSIDPASPSEVAIKLVVQQQVAIAAPLPLVSSVLLPADQYMS